MIHLEGFRSVILPPKRAGSVSSNFRNLEVHFLSRGVAKLDSLLRMGKPDDPV